MYVMQIYKDRSKKWRWRFIAPNRRIMACSGESFSSKRSAQRASENVLERLKTAAIKWQEPVRR